MARAEIFVSVDIETDGPIPGPHSMLSLGAAAFTRGEETPIATFEVNFSPLEGAAPDPQTAAWWAAQDPAVWAHITADPQPPEVAMRRFDAWVRALPGAPVLATFPSWDYLWVHWYFHRFVGRSPFGLGGMDIKTLAWSVLETPSFRDTAKRNFPPALFEGTPDHTHQALDDAIGQGMLLIRLLKLQDARRA
jgi:hypothetical protein